MAIKKLPYNCPFIEEWLEDFRNISDCFTKLGGLPYELLKHSGLDSLGVFGFFDDINWADVDAKEFRQMQSRNRIIALEVYIKAENPREPQKAYLYADSIHEYYSVFKDGVVEQGRLLLPLEKLEKWAEKGYSCIIPSEGGMEGSDISTYEKIFGARLLVCHMQPWNEHIKPSSDGYKMVYLLLNYGVSMEETRVPKELRGPKNYVVEVDYYAMNTCFKLLGRERFIRQKIDPFFLLSRIDMYDAEVGKYLKTESENTFLREVGLTLEAFPECYQRLAYYTAFIAYYYPNLQEKMNQPLPETQCVAFGASMEMCLYVAGCFSDGSVHLIRNPKLHSGVTTMIYDCKIEDVYAFDLRYDLRNAGVGMSELGLSFRDMLKNNIYQDVTKMGISLPMNVPRKEKIQQFMKNYEQSVSVFPERKAEVMLYYELELEDADGRDIIKGAAEMAGMETVETYNRAKAIHAGYESLNPKQALERYQHAIVFDWRNDYLEVTLLQGDEDGVEIFGQTAEENPLERTEDIVEEMTIYDILFRNMRDKILENGEFLQVLKLDEANTDAWREFQDSRGTVMKQLMRENNGVLVLKNAWASVEEELPYARFKEIFKPYFEETKEVIERVLSPLCFEKDDIDKVYVSGYWGNCAYVWDCLEEYFGKGKIHVMADTGKAATLGAAYLAGKQKVE